ncbi:MAG: type VI secretion system amidase effector protein Tae4 [Methylococcaceae bacterium]
MPNQAGQITTNNKGNSLLVVQKKSITFKDLWSNYPSNEIKHINPTTKKDEFGNHCAINVSHSLYKCGVLLKSFTGAKCWYCPTPNKQNKGVHVIRAQELATYLNKKPFAGCPPSIDVTKDFKNSVKGKTGIVFFKDYWQRSNESSRTGDHIDLWDGNELASIGFILTWVRTTFPYFSEENLEMSDLQKSKSILFWEIP